MLWRVAADLAQADVLVTVQVTGVCAFAVVDVPDFEVLDAALLVELIERGFRRCFGRHVVARDVEVAGVEAERDAVGLGGALDDGLAQPGEVSEVATDVAARAGGAFEAADGFEALGALEEFLVRIGDAGHALVERPAHERPGVMNEEGDRELLAAFNFDGHEVNGLCKEFVLDAGEVDEIAGVADDAGVPVEAFEFGVPVADHCFIEGFHFPLLLVFSEDLDGVEAQEFGLEERASHGV